MESSPISTPVSAAAANFPPRNAADHPGRLGDHLRAACSVDEFDSDDLLFPHDDDKLELPLFPAASPFVRMAGPASPSDPIDIATSRQSSHSPRNQQSNMSSHFPQPRIDVPQDQPMEQSHHAESMQYNKGRQESVGMLGTTPYGARSIPQRDMFRRESNALSGSMVNGMSWGGISVESFIRDE